MLTTHNIGTVLLGDTWNGLNCRVVRNSDPDITNTAIKVSFRFGSKTGPIVKTVTSQPSGGITKTDATDGRFKIDAFRVNFERPGIYYYDIQFTDGEVVKTYIAGTMTVEQDVTQ